MRIKRINNFKKWTKRKISHRELSELSILTAFSIHHRPVLAPSIHLTLSSAIYNWKSVSFWPPSLNPNPLLQQEILPFLGIGYLYLNNILSRRMNRAYFFSFCSLFVFFFFYGSFIIRFFLSFPASSSFRQVPQPFQSVYVENRMMVGLMFHNLILFYRI